MAYSSTTLSITRTLFSKKKLRKALEVADLGSTDKRALGFLDSRQLATSRLTGIDFITNDEKLFKRAKDLGIGVHFLDLHPGVSGPSKAAQRAAGYVPKTVVIPFRKVVK